MSAAHHCGLSPDQVEFFVNRTLLQPLPPSQNPGLNQPGFAEFVTTAFEDEFSGVCKGMLRSSEEAKAAYDVLIRQEQKEKCKVDDDATFPKTSAEDAAYVSQMIHALICTKDTWEGRKALSKQAIFDESRAAGEEDAADAVEEQAAGPSSRKRKRNDAASSSATPAPRVRKARELSTNEKCLLDSKKTPGQKFCAVTGANMLSDIEIEIMAWKLLVRPLRDQINAITEMANKDTGRCEGVAKGFRSAPKMGQRILP